MEIIPVSNPPESQIRIIKLDHAKIFIKYSTDIYHYYIKYSSNIQ